MTKFHINKNGIPAPCRATKANCPYGGDSGLENHFNSLKDAQLAANETNSSKYGALPGIENGLLEEARETSEIILNDTVKKTLGSMKNHNHNSFTRGNFDKGYHLFVKDGGEEKLMTMIEENNSVHSEVKDHVSKYFKPDGSSNENSEHDKKQIEKVADLVEDLRVITKENNDERSIKKALINKNIDRITSNVNQSIKVDGLKTQNDEQIEEAVAMFDKLAKHPKLNDYVAKSEKDASDWYSRNSGYKEMKTHPPTIFR